MFTHYMGRTYYGIQKSIGNVDRTLKDFRGNQKFFDGTLILLSGDFRQTLTIKARSTPIDELYACLE
jgi:hypothetical protein